jgi:integrase
VITELRAPTHSTGCVFHSSKGKPYPCINPHYAGPIIQAPFNKAVALAGLTDFHPHDCRHTWATWHYQANRDLGALQKLGGWKTLSMVLRYAHTNVAELEHTIARMN